MPVRRRKHDALHRGPALDFLSTASVAIRRHAIGFVGSRLGHEKVLSVSNSSSGRRWKLDHAPAVGDPTHMVEFGTGRRAFAREA